VTTNDKRAVQDLGLPKPEIPFRAGGKQQGTPATRKRALHDAGTIGFVPGHQGTGPGSMAQAGSVHEARQPSGKVPGDDELEYAPQRRLMPREQEVSRTPGHTGAIVRFLDGHSEIHRERPGLIEMLNDPGMAQHHGDIKNEIAMRDSVHNHRYW
jgi:hypothetical protein